MASVLCTGVYASLRKVILEGAGHVVITAPDESTLLRACRFHKFDVAIVGHRGSPGVKKQWLAVIRKYCPAAKVLEVYVADQKISLPEADDWLETPVTNHLSDRVSELAARKSLAADERDLLDYDDGSKSSRKWDRFSLFRFPTLPTSMISGSVLKSLRIVLSPRPRSRTMPSLREIWLRHCRRVAFRESFHGTR